MSEEYEGAEGNSVDDVESTPDLGDTQSFDNSSEVTDNIDTSGLPETSGMEEELGRLRERVRVLDAFERNPEAVLRDVAGRMGLELTPTGQGNSQSRQGLSDNSGNNSVSSDVPKWMVDAVSENLSPDWIVTGKHL